jgi:hypothetical protein
VSSSRRIVPPVVVPVLVVVAIVGYLMGIHRASGVPAASSSAGPAQETRIASGSSVLLEYPTGWQPAGAPTAIPGLSIAQPLLLAPGGHADHAGLLSGQLPAGGSSPLPASFLVLVRGIPHTEVVTLDNLQAYSYSGLSGYDRTLDVYVIPTVGQSPTALVCYAASGFSKYLQQCEQIVAKVTLVGQTSYDLSPSAAYAAQLSGLIAGLERERQSLRRQMHLQPAAGGTLATTLAARFAAAAASLAALEPPQPASAAQAALATALIGVGDAYTALAGTAAAEGPAGYAVAEGKIQEAEAGVNTALESFALLGYNHT